MPLQRLFRSLPGSGAVSASRMHRYLVMRTDSDHVVSHVSHGTGAVSNVSVCLVARNLRPGPLQRRKRGEVRVLDRGREVVAVRAQSSRRAPPLGCTSSSPTRASLTSSSSIELHAQLRRAVRRHLVYASKPERRRRAAPRRPARDITCARPLQQPHRPRAAAVVQPACCMSRPGECGRREHRRRRRRARVDLG